MPFTLFCREFEIVVNRANLVLIFWGEKMVGANFYAFCNYVTTPDIHHTGAWLFGLQEHFECLGGW